MSRCRNGKLQGKCWRFLPGGGALYGDIDCDGAIAGEDAVYLYSDHVTALQGVFKGGRLVSGVRMRTSKALLSRGCFLNLEFSSLRNNTEPVYRSVYTSMIVCMYGFHSLLIIFYVRAIT